MRFYELVELHVETHKRLNDGLINLVINNLGNMNNRQIKLIQKEIKCVEKKIIKLMSGMYDE